MVAENHEQRIADAIRGLADEEGRLTAPPANLWGRIERAIDDPLQAPADLVPPPPDLWDRIADEIRADAPTPDHFRAASRRNYRRLAMVAAAIVLVGALAGAVLVGRSPNRSRTDIVAQASLSGKGLDPGGDGYGSAELLRKGDGWRVAIDAEDLPTPPPGMYYEAWLLNATADQVQSLGTLRGSGKFAVPEGLTIDEFPLVDVSIEPLDGNPGHSSKSVLRGRLEVS